MSRSNLMMINERANNMDFLQSVRKFIEENTAATAIEYGLIAALIAVSILTSAQALGSQVGISFEQSATALKQ